MALMAILERDYLACFEDWKAVGISVFYWEGTTLKGINLI